MASISHIAEHNTAPVRCTDCQAEFTTVRSVMEHRRNTGHTVPLLQCPQKGCTFEAINQANLTEHINGDNHNSRWVSRGVSVQVCLSDLLNVTRTVALLLEARVAMNFREGNRLLLKYIVTHLHQDSSYLI